MIPPIPRMTPLDEEWIDYAAGVAGISHPQARGLLAAYYTMRVRRLAATPVPQELLSSDSSPEKTRVINLVMQGIDINLRAARAVELARLLDFATQDSGIPREKLFEEWRRRELIESEGHN